MRSLFLPAAVLALATVASDVSAQQQRQILGRDFLTHNETQKEEFVDDLRKANADAIDKCATGATSDQLAQRFSEWLQRNPEAGTQPAYLAFTRMLKESCEK